MSSFLPTRRFLALSTLAAALALPAHAQRRNAPPQGTQNAPASGATTSPSTPANRALIQRAEAYLNALRTLKAQFVQVSDNGTTAEGTAWIQRPGRMRFDYREPATILLVANHGILLFEDRAVQQRSNVPLSSTPLGLLLQDNLRLSGEITVDSVIRDANLVYITLHRTASPDEGSLTLSFDTDPFELRQWVVTDAQRRQTRVSLFNMEPGASIDPHLFDVVDPRALEGQPSGSGG